MIAYSKTAQAAKNEAIERLLDQRDPSAKIFARLLASGAEEPLVRFIKVELEKDHSVAGIGDLIGAVMQLSTSLLSTIICGATREQGDNAMREHLTKIFGEHLRADLNAFRSRRSGRTNE